MSNLTFDDKHGEIMKTKIYIRQEDNDRYFSQKLPTWRNAFCYIERKVTFCQDPDEVYGDGEYGTILVGGRRLVVTGNPKTGMEVDGWAK